MANSNQKSGRRKTSKKRTTPPKPYKDFPLYAHPSGNWAKKIRGDFFYFGRWGRIRNGKMERLPGDGWQEALELYKAQVDDLQAGRQPRPGKLGNDGELTIADICNKFLRYKLRRLESGEITPRTFAEYRATTDRLVAFFGKKRLVDDLDDEDFDDLRASIKFGPVRRGNEIVRIRSVFKHSRKLDIVPEEFRKPNAKVMRKHRAEGGKRLFTADEVKLLLGSASVPMKAMILLGVNCAFGNADVGDLPKSALDLDGGWVTFPRPKTGIDRRAALWTETVNALRAALAQRRTPTDKADAGCVFVTGQGNRWVREKVTKETTDTITKVTQFDSVGLEFGKLLKKHSINGRKGLGFYSLRHTFRTIADASKDFPAVRLVMGHSDSSIDAVYREQIDDDRLQAVANHVRGWLFGGEGEGGAKNE